MLQLVFAHLRSTDMPVIYKTLYKSLLKLHLLLICFSCDPPKRLGADFLAEITFGLLAMGAAIFPSHHAFQNYFISVIKN